MYIKGNHRGSNTTWLQVVLKEVWWGTYSETYLESEITAMRDHLSWKTVNNIGLLSWQKGVPYYHDCNASERVTKHCQRLTVLTGHIFMINGIIFPDKFYFIVYLPLITTKQQKQQKLFLLFLERSLYTRYVMCDIYRTVIHMYPLYKWAWHFIS